MMREVLGLDACEISHQLGISVSHCHVILHRARLKLRAVLQAGWGRELPARRSPGDGLGLATSF